MATKTFSLSSIGSAMPPGTSNEGPLNHNMPAAIFVAGVITLSSTFAAITVPAGATRVTLYEPAANAIDIVVAGNGSDVGVNMGSGWVFTTLGCKGGTATLFVKSASGTPVLAYQFN